MTARTTRDLSNDSALARAITGASYKLARQYGADVDDVQSEVTLAILERYAREPEFLEQSDSYVVSYGAWRARDVLKRECALYVNRTVEGDAPATDDGDATVLELQADDVWADVEFSFAVEQALAGLSEDDATIARLYAGGWNAQEIADEVGCSRRTVYNHLDGSIKDALEHVWV